MPDEHKTKGQLITELRELRQRLMIFEEEQKKLTLSITERKRAENIMQARLRLLKFAESHSLEEFTQATLDESEALTASIIGFYHLVEADQRTLSLQTWSTNTLQHMCTAEGKGQHYNVAEAGVWVDCVHQRRPVIHNSYDALPDRKGMPPGHAPVVRELVVPIFRADKIVAIIGVGNKPSDYDEWDVEAVSLLGDLSWDITERKRAEEALRDREAKYRAAVETSADGFCITDMAGRFLEFNDAFAHLLGYSREEMLTMSVPDIEAQLTPVEIAATIAQVQSEGHVIFETKLRSKEGRVWPVEVKLAYWPITGGRMFVFVRNIAERKSAEEALRESREDLNRAQAVARTGSWRLKSQRNELTWSDETYRIFRIPPGTALTYDAFLAAVHPEDREFVNQKWTAALGGETYDIEHRILVGDEVKWVSEKAELEVDEKGQLLGGFGTVQDITERRQAEEKNKHLASFPQMNPTPVLELDLSGAVTYYNQAAFQALEKMGPGAGWGDILPEDLGELINAAREKKEKYFYREVRIKDTVFSQNIFFAEPFNVLRVYSMDITRRQQAEEKLKQTLVDLERSNKDLEDFAYVASHDLQEPLRKIANFSEMLVKKYGGHLDEQADRYFGYISDGAKRMQALINDLLAYSRITSADFQLIETNLGDILQGTLTDLQTLIQENQAEISHDPLPALKVNPIQLRRLLQNLISNGIKFHDVHPPRLHISARREPGEWVISVRDNGIGFDPQHAEQIFKVFKRLHTKEAYPGTGIGLAICKKIVERHRGRIWAESEPVRGSTFYFTIPV